MYNCWCTATACAAADDLEGAKQDAVLHSGIYCRCAVMEAAVTDMEHGCKVVSRYRPSDSAAVCGQKATVPSTV